MRTLVLTSAGVLYNSEADRPYPNIVSALKTVADAGHEIFLISNKAEPKWLKELFPFVHFVCRNKRQDGKIVAEFIKQNEDEHLLHSEIVILGASNEDLFMASNSKTLLVRCEWARLGDRIATYGFPCTAATALPEIINFLDSRKPWYFVSRDTYLDVYSLTNAGTKVEVNADVISLTGRLKACLKNGQVEMKQPFILHFTSSIYGTPVFYDAGILGYYPSSAGQNDEIMAEFCSLPRTVLRKRLKEPLFIRHTRTKPRHTNTAEDRTNPDSQLRTINLNPFYKGKLKGQRVVVLDDYLTYGVSFSVAAAFLRQAGVAKVIGVSMGKFGNCARRYTINIHDDPFAPITKWDVSGSVAMVGDVEREATIAFLDKFRDKI